ncbi:MAG: hypothetical protein F4Z78_05360 [Gammaproteobacteria bacterium]|nr:hypothetical protein [Gammaproteobacteria bacterium]
MYPIGTPVISSPFWLSTVAASRIVSPSASSVTDEGSSVTLVATSPGGGGGASTAGTSSPQLTIRHRTAARERSIQRRLLAARAVSLAESGPADMDVIPLVGDRSIRRAS